MSWLAPLLNNRFGDALNLELRHEQLFFIRGDQVLDNVGYSEKGTRFNEADFGKPINTLEEMKRNGYWLTGRVYDPEVMREALRRQKDGHYYSVFSNQCQDWADRLKRKAAGIEKRWNLRPGEMLEGLPPEQQLALTEEKKVPPTEPASIGMGVFAILLGVAAILTPILFGARFALILGLFFLASGVSNILYAWRGGDLRAAVPIVFSALLNLAGGAFILINTTVAVMTLSLVVAITLAVQGVSHLLVAAFSRPIRNWLGTLVAGAAMLACAAMVFSRWPISGERFLGVLVGLSLIIGGLSTVYLSQRTRNETG